MDEEDKNPNDFLRENDARGIWLPDPPIDEVCNDISTEDIVSGKIKYLKKMRRFSVWLTRRLILNATRPHEVWKDETEKRQAKKLLTALIDHYVWSFRVSKTWKTIDKFSPQDEYQRKDQSTFKGGLSLQNVCFLEICRLGALCYSTIDETVKNVKPSDLPYLLASVSVLKSSATFTKKISEFTQMELDESLKFLLYRWQLLDYHPELEIYVEALNFRMFQLFTYLQDENTMDSNSFRIEIFLPDVPFVCSLETTGTDEAYHNLTRHGTNSRKTYKPNASWLFRCQTRFYYLSSKLSTFTERIKKGTPDKPEPLLMAGIDHVGRSWLKDWVIKRISNSHSTLNEQFSEEYLKCLLPPGDTEWASYAFYDNNTSGANGLLAKFHKNVYSILTKEASTDPETVIKRNDAKNVAIHDYLVLQTLHNYLKTATNGEIDFLSKFTLKHSDFFRKLSFLKKKGDKFEPVLVQFFSRYLVYYEKSVYWDPDVYYSIQRLVGLFNGKHREIIVALEAAKREWEKTKTQKNAPEIDRHRVYY